LQEALSSRYDTGEPHLGLANFHEILTITVLRMRICKTMGKMTVPYDGQYI
jgi:hypothetical protein